MGEHDTKLHSVIRVFCSLMFAAAHREVGLFSSGFRGVSLGVSDRRLNLHWGTCLVFAPAPAEIE